MGCALNRPLREDEGYIAGQRMRLCLPRQLCFWLLLLGCSLAICTAAADPDLDSVIRRELPSLLSIYKSLHAAPELSRHETNTASLAARELASAGCTVTTNLGKFSRPEWKGHGVVGVLQNGTGPVVLVRSELDALPVEEKTGLSYASKVKTKNEDGQEVGVMHACGHDLHLTAMLGLARVLAARRDSWRGTVVLVAEPGEETLDGARALIADGLYERFPKPNYILAIHGIGDLEAGKVGVIPGPAMSTSQVVEIILRGKGGHASRPHEAKDPIVLAAQVILAIQTIVSREMVPGEPGVITVGAIQGGTKANVIPDQVRLLVSVRASSDELRLRQITAIDRIVRGLARAAGIPDESTPLIRPSDIEFTPATYNDPALNERLAEAFSRTLGIDNVVRLKQRPGADTISNYALVEGRTVPAALIFLGVSDPVSIENSRRGFPVAATHSPRYAPLAEPSLRTAIRALSAALTELLPNNKK